jgi:hypothetical protein
MRSVKDQFREEAAQYWASDEGRQEASDPWSISRFHYFRFLGGASDDAAIDGWSTVMERRRRMFESVRVG